MLPNDLLTEIFSWLDQPLELLISKGTAKLSSEISKRRESRWTVNLSYYYQETPSLRILAMLKDRNLSALCSYYYLGGDRGLLERTYFHYIDEEPAISKILGKLYGHREVTPNPDCLAIVEWFISIGIDLNSLILMATELEDLEFMGLLESEGIDLDYHGIAETAARYGHIGMLKWLDRVVELDYRKLKQAGSREVQRWLDCRKRYNKNHYMWAQLPRYSYH